MNVVFRTDSSAEMGLGHVARCLALAQELARQGDRCVFVCRPAPGDGIVLVERAGHTVAPIAPATDARAEAAATCDALAGVGINHADWLVVDHYALDGAYESEMRRHTTRIAVIADFDGRPHDCDILLDHNIGACAAAYDSHVPRDARVLAGARFALLREQFAMRRRPRSRDGSVQRLLVSFGGTDPTNETEKALQALGLLGDTGIATDVVLPEGAPHRLAVETYAARVPYITLRGRVEDMAELMTAADLMLGAGGVTLLERCALGLPSISLVVADNQALGTRAAADAGATIDMGGEASAPAIADALRSLLEAPDAVRRMARAARELMGSQPGSGARIVVGLMRCMAGESTSRLRALRAEDRPLLREWRNSDRVRSAMSSQHLVGEGEHAAWFDRVLKSEPRHHFIFECGDVPLGLVSFRDVDVSAATCEWGFYIGEPWAPKGSGVRMGELALDAAFGELGMVEVRAKALVNNAASLAYHSKLGFRDMGTVIGPAPDGNAILTWQQFALSASEWAVRGGAIGGHQGKEGAR